METTINLQNKKAFIYLVSAFDDITFYWFISRDHLHLYPSLHAEILGESFLKLVIYLLDKVLQQCYIHCAAEIVADSFVFSPCDG
jgi:hypothetical protein